MARRAKRNYKEEKRIEIEREKRRGVGGLMIGLEKEAKERKEREEKERQTKKEKESANGRYIRIHLPRCVTSSAPLGELGP